MPLQETSGNATTDAYGGGVAVVPNYIEQVFSTYLWNTSTSNQTIDNGIDMTKGALTWIKSRSYAFDHVLQTGAGTGAAGKGLASNSTMAAFNGSYRLTDTTSGFTMGTDYYSAGNPNAPCVVWTFRKQPKFFDVVTYTGNGTLGRTVSHNLGSVPGCIIVKNTSNGTVNWAVYHRSVGNTGALYLNTTNATDTWNAYWNDTTPTSTNFTLGNSTETNANGATYVAYLFAHDAGGFGLTGTDNVISCGSFTTTVGGSYTATVDLGYEPQWILMKSTGATGNWFLFDNMRGMPVNYPTAGSSTGRQALCPNLSNAEFENIGPEPTATGFTVRANADSYIYIAIRRGPMKVPTSGTSVFAPVTYTGNGSSQSLTAGFPIDLSLFKYRGGATNSFEWFDRLRGTSPDLRSAYTYAELATTTEVTSFASNTQVTVGASSDTGGTNASGQTYVLEAFRRAPSFFDEVCYTGTGTNQFINHNLGVQPDLYIVKRRSATANWVVTINASIPDTVGILNSTNAFGGSAYNNGYLVNGTVPASNFGAGFGSVNNDAANASGSTYVAYLFATCAGVSKVGSYTGNGSSQTINCGFTGGARFVLIKRTDSTGDWYVYDTARGMTTLTDPYLLLNSTAAESATLGSVTTVSTGFAVNASILAAINTNGASYIFLAVS